MEITTVGNTSTQGSLWNLQFRHLKALAVRRWEHSARKNLSKVPSSL